MTAIISACIFKKSSKFVNFCVAILILKMEEDTHFQHIMLYYFKKGKNAIETPKRLVNCTEKVLWLIECVKSGLWSFLVLLTYGQIILCRGTVLCIGRCLAALLAFTHKKPIVGDSQHTQNIEINQVTGQNEKCLLFYGKKHNGLLANPIFYLK